MKLIKDLGHIFPTDTSKVKRHYALYACDCGREIRSRCNSKLIPDRKQCRPCSYIDMGITNTINRRTNPKPVEKPLIRLWSSQKTRCKNIDNPKYGGRGITFAKVFEDYDIWYGYISSLPGFKDREQLHLTMDRVHNNSGYEPMNLRWATQSQQNSNRRGYGNNMEKYYG